MNLVTLMAFEDELASIQKEAGLKDVWTKGTKPIIQAYERTGAKTGVHAENLLAAARKVPIIGKPLRGVGVGDVTDVARRLMT